MNRLWAGDKAQIRPPECLGVQSGVCDGKWRWAGEHCLWAQGKRQRPQEKRWDKASLLT